jgi:hypothetical protein
MKKKTQKMMTTLLVLLGLTLSAAGVVQAIDATMEIDPAEPTKKSTVTFTATLDDDTDVTTVTLEMQECNANTGICHTQETYTMSRKSSGVYEKTVTLQYDDTTYIQYNLEAETSTGTETLLDKETVDLKVDTSNGGGNGGNGSPGFEAIGVFLGLALLIGITYRRRKEK